VSEPKHAWYSSYQVEQNGSVFYLDGDGKEIEVTHVSSDENSPRPDDSMYKGKVVRFLRTGQESLCKDMDCGPREW